MGSQYDVFWTRRLEDVRSMLKQANSVGRSDRSDVSDIKQYGKRPSGWSGTVVVCQDRLWSGAMAHAKSLGEVILKARLLEPYGGTAFRLSIGKDLHLIAKREPQRQETVVQSPEPPSQPLPGRDSGKQEKRLVTILHDVPWAVWQGIVREEPEWHQMEGFLSRLGYGKFAVLMIATGLNDYQLKGRAEVAYWPPLCEHLQGASEPKTISDMETLLNSFYQTERLYTTKLKRLKRFMSSPLAGRLWTTSPRGAESPFVEIWQELSQTMRQKPAAKTIAFAMKCLGISLLMVRLYGFDFGTIPIPVDLRVRRFTERAGLPTGSDRELQEAWQGILAALQRDEPRITMIHLDSLVWQIASLEKQELVAYFNRLDASGVGRYLSALLDEGYR